MTVVLRHPAALPSPLLNDRIRKGTCHTFLVVVPTKRRIRHLAREFVGRMPGHIAPHPHLYTLETLAAELFRRLRPGTAMISGVAQALLFRSAIQSCGPTMRFFTLRKGPFPLQRGTFETITTVISRLKESGITPDLLAGELEMAEPDEVHKLADVISIYRAYEEALGKGGQTDVGGVYQRLALGCTQEQFTVAFRSAFPRVDLVAIAGFDEFSHPELGLLRKLQMLPGVSIELTFDFRPGNPALFGNLEENYQRFLEVGLQELPAGKNRDSLDLVLGGETASQLAGSSFEKLVGRLFLGGEPREKVDLTGTVTLVQARDRQEEADLVCRLIKRMLLEDPSLDLGRICVAMHAPAAYTPLFRRAFARHGVPANITDRYELSRSPLVVALLGLLQVSARGFRREDVLRVVDAPYFCFTEEGAAGGHVLNDVSRRLKITAGYKLWLSRIDEAVRDAEEQAAPGAAPRRHTPEEEYRTRLQTARTLIERLHALLEPFEHPLDARGFEEGMLTLLGRLKVRDRLVAPPARDPADRTERDVRAFARVLDVLGEITAALTASEEPDVRRPLAFYLESLSVAVSAERFNVRERFGQGVLVTAIEETRGLPMDVMFLVGLVDGEFPSVYQPEVFYSLARQKLRARRHVWEQRYLFYQAITNWSRRLYLTHPEQEGELELVRSTFVDALLDVVDVGKCRAKELMAGEEILSMPDLLRFAAGTENFDVGRLPGTTEDVEREVRAVTRAVAVERSRLQTHALPSHEGVIGLSLPGAARKVLQSLTTRIFSVSQLESYSVCPFQFFGTRVLRLSAIEDFREDLSPIERGSLVHDVLFEFMKDRRERGMPDLWRCTDEEAAAAEQELVDIARARFERIELPDPFRDADRDALIGSGDRPGMLQEYIRVERGRNTPLEARFFEVAFGPRMTASGACDRELSSEEPVIIGSVRLRGRVDRVEIGGGIFSIIDYKTGHPGGGLDAIREGTSLQLPLYLRAIQQLLQSRLNISATPASGLYYHLAEQVALRPVLASDEHRGVAFDGKSRSRQIVATDDELRQLIDATVARTGEFVAAMAEGHFPLTPPERIARVCRSCDLSTVCRIQATHHVQQEVEEI